MSALARWFKFKGCEVSGYDRTPSPLTEALVSEGIPVHYEDRPELIPSEKEDTLVIYTPAIPQDLGELRKAFDEGYKVVKRSRALGEVTRGKRCFAVAGTHGKTTTSTLTAHIFSSSGEGCSAFLGGISRNFGSNLVMSDNDNVVVEADEFDRSFLALYPETAVITAMDADHLDIYGDKSHVVEAFRAFASQVSGTLIKKIGLDITPEHTSARILNYSYDDCKADFYGTGARPDELGRFIFDLHYPGGVIRDVKVGTPGWINAENAIAASAIALTYGISPEAVKEAVGSFEGVKRRLELHYHTPSLSYIDDYAHHPAELASAISSMRDIFPSRKITAIFQPHLYTRTRDFAEDFAKSLSMVDKLILLPIYPAREEPIPGVTSSIILDKVSCEKVLVEKSQLLEYLEKEPLDVLVTFGAGDVDRFVEPITQLIKKRV